MATVMGFKWLQDPELQILALYLRREVGLGRGGLDSGDPNKVFGSGHFI